MRAQTDEVSGYDFIIGLIYERCRVRLHEGKHQLSKARLGKRMRHHGFESLGQYCDYLRRTGDEDEITKPERLECRPPLFAAQYLSEDLTHAGPHPHRF